MKKIATLLFALLITCTAATAQKKQAKCTLNVATFNLRMDTPKDGVNAWPNRKEMVKSLVQFYDFDIMGTQEGFKHMLDGIGEMKDYAYFGRGRDDGKDGGEHSAIFYKKARFELLAHGDFWFSEHPDKPGLGIDINEDECEKHPYQVHTLRHYTGALTNIRPAKTKFYF